MNLYRFFSLLLQACFLVVSMLLPGAAECRNWSRHSAVAPSDEIYVESERPSSAGKVSASDKDTPEEPGVTSAAFETLKKRIIQAWEYDIYVPAYTWYNRLAYDSSHIRRYNETPWGGGIGRSLYDEDGDSHSLYLMAFMDSHDYVQGIGGYAYIKNWHPDESRDRAFGVGYTLSLTGRYEHNYIPMPLPIVSARYKQLAVQAAYIPGVRNNGNVLFTWPE